MKGNQTRRLRSGQQGGFTLLVVMMVLLLLVGIGTSTIFFSAQHMDAAHNLKSRTIALNAAQAGIQHARQVLANMANNGATFCPGNPANPWTCALQGHSYNSSTAKDALPTSSNAATAGAVLFDGTTALDMVAYPNDGLQPVLGYYVVYIRNDPAELNQAAASASPNANMLIDTNHTVILRAIGYEDTSARSATAVLEAAIMQVSTVTGGSLDDFVFGKNVDAYGSNSMSGAVKF